MTLATSLLGLNPFLDNLLLFEQLATLFVRAIGNLVRALPPTAPLLSAVYISLIRRYRVH